MLRTGRELALDDLTEASKYAADQFEKLVRLSRTPALSDLIVDLEKTHRRHVARLEETIRRMGNLPSAPDPDREAFDRLATRVKAALAGDHDRVVAENCRQIEAHVVETIHRALEKDLPEEVRLLLSDLEGDCNRMSLRLEDFLRA